jgi:hypothetical protein
MPFEYLIEEMKDSLLRGQYDKTGLLMDLHQTYLHLAGFSHPDYEQWLRRLRGMGEVYGAKASCSRGKGAIILLHSQSLPIEELQHRENLVSDMGIRVLLAMNEPVAGLKLGC